MSSSASQVAQPSAVTPSRERGAPVPRFIVWPDEIARNPNAGGKALALARLVRAGMNVPPWFLVLPEAGPTHLDAADLAILRYGSSAEAADNALARIRLCEAVRPQLDAALERLCPSGELLAVRSSAVGEDGATHSYAGQLNSYLDVDPAAVLARIAAVWASGFADRLRVYRRTAGLDPIVTVPAVIVQRMIDADAAGVAFSADPVSGVRSIAVIAAVAGRGDALAAGHVNGSTWEVDLQNHVRASAITADVGLTRSHDCLARNQIVAVAALARRAEALFGAPQDIEWAVAEGRIHLLQSRPITALATRGPGTGLRVIWDNSNIVENYGGVTTPLTFSFARHVYESVYTAFCREMGIPASAIAKQSSPIRRMLGLLAGRMYYNVLNWHRLLALLPGYKQNRLFLEQMLGLSASAPADAAAAATPPNLRERVADAVRLARFAERLLRLHFALPRRIRRFRSNLSGLLRSEDTEVDKLRPDQLAQHYRQVERVLADEAGTPALNDFAVMIFHGTLRKLIVRWGGPEIAHLEFDLLRGPSQTIHKALSSKLRALAQIASGRPSFVGLLCEGSGAEIERELRGWPEFERCYQAYLDAFGNRVCEELKLESTTFHEDPLPLLRAVGRCARTTEAAGVGADRGEEMTLADAKRRARRALKNNPVKVLVFGWVLRNAQSRLWDRETLRFDRATVFAYARRIFLAFGRHLAARDVLDDRHDVAYLEVEEILAYVDGCATTTDLNGLVALRKREYASHHRAVALPDRFETSDIPYVSLMARTECAPAHAEGRSRTGMACCRGIVRGPVRLVRDARTASVAPGEIIVAERTDPGWITILPAAAGLLVERGNVLSHAAIVARELGVPTVVSIVGLTAWLMDGDWVEMDGATGVVSKLKEAERRGGNASIRV